MRRRCLVALLTLSIVLAGNGCGRGEDRPGQVTTDSKSSRTQPGIEK